MLFIFDVSTLEIKTANRLLAISDSTFKKRKEREIEQNKTSFYSVWTILALLKMTKPWMNNYFDFLNYTFIDVTFAKLLVNKMYMLET